MAEPIRLTVPPAMEGWRVDRVVAALLGVSRAGARALFDSGVIVDGSPARAADRATAGAVILVPPPAPEEELLPEPVDFEVVYEDEDVIVVDKPPWLVVHPGAGRRGGTLAAGLLHRYPELAGVGAKGRWGLVHRLDRETSGLLLVARNRESFSVMSGHMAARRVGRNYLALVSGTFAIPTGTIEAPIGRDPGQPTRRALVPSGKPARTHYEVLEVFPDHEATLLEVSLDTGRTHQIRVHLAAIGHPLIGDRTYAGAPGRVSGPRLFLHAHRLRFPHPRHGDQVEMTSPLPADLDAVLEDLR